MGFWKFYRAVFAYTFGGKFGYAGSLSGITGAALSIFWYFYSKQFPLWEAALVWGPIAMFCAGVLIIAIRRLIIAPHTIYLLEHGRANAAEIELRNRKKIKLVPFATAATNVMGYEQHKEFLALHKKAKSPNATEEDQQNLRTASQVRSKRMRGKLESGVYLASGEKSDQEFVEIPSDFWEKATFNFGKGTAEFGDVSYKNIRVGESADNNNQNSF